MKRDRDHTLGIDDQAVPLETGEAEESQRVPAPLQRYPIESELSSVEEEQVEWEMDQLVRLVGLHLARRADSADWTDAALLGELTRELREGPRREDDWSAEEVAAIRERVLRRVRDRRAGFRSVSGRLPLRAASVPAPPLVAMKEAALEQCAVHIDPAVAAGAGREIWDGECDQWVEYPPDMPPGDYLTMTIDGDSMLPLLHAGDAILVKVSEQAAPGTIVVARDPDDRYVVKRVGRVSAALIELVSENPAYAALRISRSRGAIVGTVVLRWCPHAEGAARDG